MAETAVVKSNNASKKRKTDGLGGSKSEKSLASTSTARITETFEDSLLSLLMSNVPTSEYTDAKSDLPDPNEGTEAVIKRTFHLGGSKYIIYQGSHGLIENIYLKEWEDGEVKNQGIKLSVPKIVVILHFVEFIMSATRKILEGKETVDSSYHIGMNSLMLPKGCIQNTQRYILVNPVFWMRIELDTTARPVTNVEHLKRPSAEGRWMRTFLCKPRY